MSSAPNQKKQKRQQPTKQQQGKRQKQKKLVVFPVAAAPTKTLEHLVWKRYSVLIGIRKKLYAMKAVDAELIRVKRGRNFTVWNDILWNQMLDARDKCYSDLYSFTVELRHGMPYFDPNSGAKRPPKGHNKDQWGLLIYLRDHLCGQLSRTYRPKNTNYPKDLVKKDQEMLEARFARMFPNCRTDTPSADDIEQLCRTFQAKVEPLRLDRNQNRVHVYEQGEVVTLPKMLDFTELEELFDYCEDMLRSFYLFMGKGSIAKDMNMNHADGDETARDLIDLVLFGNIEDVRKYFRDRPRDEVYDRLHQLFDEIEKEDGHPRCFNDVVRQPVFLKEIGLWEFSVQKSEVPDTPPPPP